MGLSPPLKPKKKTKRKIKLVQKTPTPTPGSAKQTPGSAKQTPTPGSAKQTPTPGSAKQTPVSAKQTPTPGSAKQTPGSAKQTPGSAKQTPGSAKQTPSPPHKNKTLKKKLKSPKDKNPIKTMKKKLILTEDTDLKISVEHMTMASTPKIYNEIFIDMLGELADILQRQGEPFKARAYQQAQETIMTYPGDISDIKQLKGLKGIGSAIESKLEEYIKTGTLKLLERERLNPLNVLTRVYGIGPKKAKELIDKGINSIDELKEVTSLLNETQQTGLKYFDAIETRIPRSEIDEYKQVFEKVFALTTQSGSTFEIVGSYRRGALTSGDIDIIITADNPSAFKSFLDQLIKDKVVIEVLSRGKMKSLTIAQLPGKIPRRVDFLYTPPEEYAFALLYFTGSKTFNTVQRQRALALGYTLNEHGITHMVNGKKGESVADAFPDERAIFTFLGMKYKEPQERKDGRAVELLSTEEPINAIEPIAEPIAEPNAEPIAEPPKKKQLTLKKKPLAKVDNLTKFKQEGLSALTLMTEKDLSKLIQDANEAYYCPSASASATGPIPSASATEPLMTDNEYDILREYTLEHYPKNKAANEGHTQCLKKIEKNKVKLPYEMWSMDKIKPSTDALTKWKQTYTGPYVISCKLDGISALYSTENKEPKLYTRGDGTIGQDISHLIPHLKLPYMKGLVIRGEIIIKKAIFLEKYSKQFANPRNFVAGVVNQKTTDSDKYADLSFVAYEVIKPVLKPSEQFSMLEDTSNMEVALEVALEVAKHMEVAKHQTLTFKELTNDKLSALLIEWRATYNYEIDGIICIDDKIYPRPKGNPPYAFAFKMVLSDQVAEAKVVDVIWTPSKDGYLKPRVQIEPINLGGVTIEYATGFNAKFIVENNIGIGALIRLIRSGDVIPHITDVVQPASQPLLPSVAYEWNATEVDILLKDKSADATVKEKTISGFFTNIDVDGLGPGNIKRMIEAGYDTVAKIVAATEADFLKVEGFKTKLAHKIYTNIKQQLEKASLPELMHASNIFGRGFGTKKLTLILKAYPNILMDADASTEKIQKIKMVEGMAKKTAEQFVKEIPAFIAFLTGAKLQAKLGANGIGANGIGANGIGANGMGANGMGANGMGANGMGANASHPLYKKKWLMTGFRDKVLSDKLLLVGAEQASSVNKNTAFLIVKDLEEDNVKVQTAKKLGIPIMTPEEVEAKYLL
jgi:NAD-dependent DNA ligase